MKIVKDWSILLGVLVILGIVIYLFPIVLMAPVCYLVAFRRERGVRKKYNYIE